MTRNRLLLIIGVSLAVVGVAIWIYISRTKADQAAEVNPPARPTQSPSQISTPAPSPTPSIEPPPPTPSSSAPVISADGALLKSPEEGAEERELDPDDGCVSLADRGYKPACGLARTSGGELIWLTEQKESAPGSLRAYVFKKSGTLWTPLLFAEDASRTNWVEITSKVFDISGDGKDEILFGFRLQGSSTFLEIDAVDGSGQVVFHRSLNKGRAKAYGGRLEDWSAQFGPGEANCCPSSFLHSVIRFDSGRWRLAASDSVKPETLPTSDL